MNVPGTFNSDDWTLSMCTFQELPSGSVLQPECPLMGRFTMKFAEWIHASLGMKPSLADVCLPDNLTRPGSPLFYSPRLFPSFSAVLCSLRLLSLQPAGEGKHQNKPPSKGLFVLQRQKAHLHSFLPLSAYLLHTPSVSMSLSPVSSAQQCLISVSRPTHQNTTAGRPELLPLSGTQSPLSRSALLYLSLPRQRESLNLHPFLPPSLKNWWPHPTPTSQWLHQAAAAFKAAEKKKKCWWRGTINTAAVSGTPGWDRWEETSGTYQPPRPNIIRAT